MPAWSINIQPPNLSRWRLPSKSGKKTLMTSWRSHVLILLCPHLKFWVITLQTCLLRVGKLASKARAAAEAITTTGIKHQEARNSFLLFTLHIKRKNLINYLFLQLLGNCCQLARPLQSAEQDHERAWNTVLVKEILWYENSLLHNLHPPPLTIWRFSEDIWRYLPNGWVRSCGSFFGQTQPVSGGHIYEVYKCNYNIDFPNPTNQEAAKQVQEAEGIKDSHDRRSVPRFDVLSIVDLVDLIFSIFNGLGESGLTPHQ